MKESVPPVALEMSKSGVRNHFRRWRVFGECVCHNTDIPNDISFSWNTVECTVCLNMAMLNMTYMTVCVSGTVCVAVGHPTSGWTAKLSSLQELTLGLARRLLGTWPGEVHTHTLTNTHSHTHSLTHTHTCLVSMSISALKTCAGVCAAGCRTEPAASPASRCGANSASRCVAVSCL